MVADTLNTTDLEEAMLRLIMFPLNDMKVILLGTSFYLQGKHDDSTSPSRNQIKIILTHQLKTIRYNKTEWVNETDVSYNSRTFNIHPYNDKNHRPPLTNRKMFIFFEIKMESDKV